MKKEKHYKYLGIIFINGGSSWYQDDDIGKVAIKTAKICKEDWGRYYKLKNQIFTVNIFDISKFKDGWVFNDYLGRSSMICKKTKKPIKLLKEVFVV